MQKRALFAKYTWHLNKGAPGRHVCRAQAQGKGTHGLTIGGHISLDAEDT